MGEGEEEEADGVGGGVQGYDFPSSVNMNSALSSCPLSGKKAGRARFRGGEKTRTGSRREGRGQEEGVDGWGRLRETKVEE